MDIISKTCKKAKQMQYDNIVTIKTDKITFDPDLRAYCVANSCGKYNTNWCCPPACGEYDELKQMVLSYEDAVVVQKIYKIEDSFDIEGMLSAGDDFESLFYELDEYIYKQSKIEHYSLKAGSCNLCKKCTYPKSPCRFPDKARPPLEACCINVVELSKTCNISYINGKNTVSYVAMFLL